MEKVLERHIEVHTIGQTLKEERSLYRENGSLAPMSSEFWEGLASEGDGITLQTHDGRMPQLTRVVDSKPSKELHQTTKGRQICLWPCIDTYIDKHTSGKKLMFGKSAHDSMEDWERNHEQEISGTWLKHKELIRRLSIGQSFDVISEQTGYSRSFVQQFAKSPVAKDKIREMQKSQDEMVEEARKRIIELSQEAVGVLEGIVNGSDEEATAALRFKAAESILSRAGIPQVTKNEGMHAHAHYLDKDSMQELKRRAISQGIINGKIVDCEESSGGHFGAMDS